MRHSRQPTGLYTVAGREDLNGATSASQAAWSSARFSSMGCLQCGQSVRSSRCPMTPLKVALSR